MTYSILIYRDIDLNIKREELSIINNGSVFIFIPMDLYRGFYIIDNQLHLVGFDADDFYILNIIVDEVEYEYEEIKNYIKLDGVNQYINIVDVENNHQDEIEI